MIDKLNILGVDQDQRTAEKEEPLLTQSNKVMEKIMSIFQESKQNVGKIQQNLDVLEKMSNMGEYSTEQKTDKLLSLSMKKIIKNNLQFIEKNRKLLAMIKVIQQTKTENLDEQDYNIINQNYESIVNQNQQTFMRTLEIQKGVKKQIKGKVKRQLAAIDPNLTDQQIEELSEDPKQAQEEVQKRILGVTNLRLVNQLQDIKLKYDDILVLDENIKTIHQIITQISDLTNLNQERTQQVREDVLDVQENIEQGVENLTQAKKNEKEVVRNKCWLMMIIVVVVIVFFGPIILSILNAQNII